MQMIDVACAIIEKDGRVLAAQRSEKMSLPLKWEFPGGKIEPGEDAAACLAREIEEELGIAVAIRAALSPSEWRYPDFTIRLHPFVCTLADGRKMHLLEHKAVCWLSPAELPALDWAAADAPVLRHYFDYLQQHPASPL